MRLRIQHVTEYTYRKPVELHRHRLVLRPREGHDLRVEQVQLQMTPSYHLQWVRDVFGNSIALVDWLEPAQTLRIVNDVIVERLAPFPARALHEPWVVPFPPQYDPGEAAVVAVYTDPSYPADVPAVKAWLDAEAFANPGVAARFASGYLHGSASQAGQASMHAWAEVYLPTLGWRGFDPTIGDVTSMHHIVTGVSTHPRGVMPVSGSFSGGSADYVGLTVTVTTTRL